MNKYGIKIEKNIDIKIIILDSLPLLFRYEKNINKNGKTELIPKVYTKAIGNTA